MKFKVFRFVAILCLVTILSLTFFVQSPAFAKEADEGRSIGSSFKEWITNPTERPGTGSPSVENVTDALTRDFRGLFEFDSPGASADIKPTKGIAERDRERRDTVKEVTGERHTPGGGPQDN